MAAKTPEQWPAKLLDIVKELQEAELLEDQMDTLDDPLKKALERIGKLEEALADQQTPKQKKNYIQQLENKILGSSCKDFAVNSDSNKGIHPLFLFFLYPSNFSL
jgi:hypothetical protein